MGCLSPSQVWKVHRGIGGQLLPVPFPIPGSSFEAHIIIGRNSSKTDPFQTLTRAGSSPAQVLSILGAGFFKWTEAEKPGLNSTVQKVDAGPFISATGLILLTRDRQAWATLSRPQVLIRASYTGLPDTDRSSRDLSGYTASRRNPTAADPPPH